MPHKPFMVDRICVVCGAAFKVRRYLISRYPCAYCSTACAGKARVGKDGHGRGKYVRAEIVRLYVEEGLTLEEVGARVGMVMNSVAYQLEKAGVARRPSPTNPHWLMQPEVRAKISANRPRGEHHALWRDVPMDELLVAYAAGSSTAMLAERYGVNDVTIGRRLRAAGVQLRKRGFAEWRSTKDGHRVPSGWEQSVDDWLSEHLLAHTLHPRVPFDRRQHADFLVDDHYIEVWGVVHHDGYAAVRTRKLELYAEYGLSLIEVWPEQVLRGDFSMFEGLL